MQGRPVVLQVTVNSDPVPGVFHTVESVEQTVQRILTDAIGHYHPRVELDAAASLRANLQHDQERAQERLAELAQERHDSRAETYDPQD